MQSQTPHKKWMVPSVLLTLAACLIRWRLHIFSGQFFFFLFVSAFFIGMMIFDFSQFDFGPLSRHWRQSQNWTNSHIPPERKPEREGDVLFWFVLLVVACGLFAFHPKGLLFLAAN